MTLDIAKVKKKKESEKNGRNSKPSHYTTITSNI